MENRYFLKGHLATVFRLVLVIGRVVLTPLPRLCCRACGHWKVRGLLLGWRAGAASMGGALYSHNHFLHL